MQKKSFISRFLFNIYVRNILLMIVIVILLITITLVLLNVYTRHNESVIVPNITGLQVEEAEGLLNANSLTYVVIDSAYLANGKPGAIIDQIPDGGSKVKKGKKIYLTIQAKGKQMVAIPALLDYSQRQAEAQLNALGFNNIIISEVPSQYKGLVISVVYNGSEILPNQKVPKGATLKMVVGGGGDNSDSQDEANVEQSFLNK